VEPINRCNITARKPIHDGYFLKFKKTDQVKKTKPCSNVLPKHRDSLSQYNSLFLRVHNHTESFILEQRYDSMTTSIVENCPNCGKENQYVMGSCRNCGTERPINRILQ
jgi:hypothetical protein